MRYPERIALCRHSYLMRHDSELKGSGWSVRDRHIHADDIADVVCAEFVKINEVCGIDKKACVIRVYSLERKLGDE